MNEKKQQFIELRAKGNSYNSIAESIGVSKPTLIKWSDELESELANYKAIELESLRDQYLATKRHRVMVLGTQLTAIRDELGNRDLSEVSTSKLIELAIKLSDSLAKEEEPIMFTSDNLKLDSLGHSWAA
ncbi:hypothetical protein HYX70_04705 [Candidatus Saccharibacteria bacterium]|nr:hypothetical protein [Candidatus Saccharibacteria bacterium]